MSKLKLTLGQHCIELGVKNMNGHKCNKILNWWFVREIFGHISILEHITIKCRISFYIIWKGVFHDSLFFN